MKLRPTLIFIKDLFDVLPTRARAEWSEIDSVSADKPTVILVSGFAATHRNLSVMRKRLMRDGFNVLIVALDWHSLSDSVRGLYRMAEQLSSTVLRLRKRAGMRRSKIFLVAHSAGGLVARHYVQVLGGSHYCEALVTLATPHHGTWVAALGLFTHLILKARCLFQMLPCSPFIRAINAAPFPVGFRLVSIYSSDDFLAYPKSTRLPESWYQKREIEAVELHDLSHSDFLLSKESYRALLQHLRPEVAEEKTAAATTPNPV